MTSARLVLDSCAVIVILFTATVPLVAQVQDLPPIAPQQARPLIELNGLDGPGLALAADEKTGLLAAGCDGGTIQLWHKDVVHNVRAGSYTSNVLRGHEGVVLDLAWTSGTTLASTGADGKVILWDVSQGKIVHALSPPHFIRELAMSPDGKLLAGVGDGNSILLWDLGSGKLLKELHGHKDWILSIAFSHDGKHLLSGGYEGKSLLWDINADKPVRELPAPLKEEPKQPSERIITQVAFNFDGKQVALGRANGDIQLINPDNGQPIRVLKGHTSAITGLAYHPSNTLLVSCSKDGTIRLWNPADGGNYKTLSDHKSWVEDVMFLANGTKLASVSADRTVRIWGLTPP